jgi:hypothetical protein
MRVKEQDINPVHSFDVADAVEYGSIEKALLIKEIRGLQVYKLRRNLDGWVYYSAQALAAKFPYMTRSSIDRRLRELVSEGYLEVEVRNKVKYDQTKSFRLPNLSVSIGENEQSTLPEMSNDTDQNEQPIPSLSSLTSPSEPSLASPFSTARSGSQLPKKPGQRGEESPAKERLRAALRSGDLGALKVVSGG